MKQHTSSVVITAQSPFHLIDFNELLRYRELLIVFAWRDIMVRYKQTVLGLAWVVFQPVISTIIFTVFFGKLAKIQSGSLPYWFFVFCGLVFWNFFSQSVSLASESVIANESIIKKVYFPRLILPLSSVITAAVDFGVNLTILILAGFITGFFPRWEIIFMLPLAVIITVLTALGLGSFLCAFNTKYRDVRYIIPFFIQIFLFLTPVIYPSTILSPVNKIFLFLNPLSAPIEIVRWLFSPSARLDGVLITISAITCILIFVLGLWTLSRVQRFLADII